MLHIGAMYLSAMNQFTSICSFYKKLDASLKYTAGPLGVIIFDGMNLRKSNDIFTRM